jgi:hypothetical protein
MTYQLHDRFVRGSFQEDRYNIGVDNLVPPLDAINSPHFISRVPLISILTNRKDVEEYVS